MAVEPVARKPLHEVFAEQIIEDLKLGVAPWQKPWLPGQLYPPMNPVSGTVYSGINRLMLSRKGYADPRWMTLRQANSIECRVRKGEKSQPIVFWQFTKDVPATDEQGKPVLDADGKQVMETVQLARPIVRFSSVFHVSQLEGNVPPLDVSTLVRTWDPDEKAEAILANSGAVIRHNQRSRAFYSPAKDEICLPPMEQFPTPGNYYSTALHELGHWTGHESRMAREFGPFGSDVYAREELRAEIASWMLGQDMGIGYDPGQHLSYVNSWIKVLEQDPYEIVRACRDAERIKDYVLAMEHKQELGKGQETASPNLSLPEGWSESRPGGLATNKDPVNGGIVDKVMLSTPEEWFAIPNDDGLVPELKDKFFPSRAEAFAALKHAVEQSLDGASTITIDSKHELGGQRLLVADCPKGSEFEAKKMIHDLAKGVGEGAFSGFISQVYPDDKPPHRVIQFKDLQKVFVSHIARDVDPSKEPSAPSKVATGKMFLAVPFREKNLAKAAGAKWDVEAKMWFAPDGADLDKLKGWLPQGKAAAPHKSMPPIEEFAQALRAAGLDLQGQSPIMDGKIHRVPVLGGKPQARDGAYQGHLDGVPNGWYQNYLTGEKTRWKATGHTLTPRQKEELRREGEERERQRQQERTKLQDHVADMCALNFSVLPPPMPSSTTPYLLKKGIPPLGRVKVASDGQTLLVPLHNAEGQLRNVQEIGVDGEKRFQAGAEKKGCFFLIAPHKGDHGEILLAEGYATGVSLHMATGLPVAVAFDAGNLEPVAKTMREKFPEAKIAICADNDLWTTRPNGKPWNPGAEFASQAAQAVGGCWVAPAFTQEELATRPTDFNDLHRARGLEAVKQQVSQVLENQKCQGIER